MTLPSDLKQKWIDSLRSGEFKQGKGRMKKGDTYCCLGVLAVIKGIQFSGDDADATIIGPCGLYDSLFPELTHNEVCELFSRNDGKYNLDTGERGPQQPFTEIADYIEAHL